MENKELDLTSLSSEWRVCFEMLLDPEVSEIECNGYDSFFIKKSGKRIKLDINLRDDKTYLSGIEKSLVPQIRTFKEWDSNGYIFEGPLEFILRGQRIKARTHIVLAPATYTAQITIAKRATSLATLDSIAARGSMSREMMEFLQAAVTARLSIVFSGGTGAGKTTMLEALTKYIPMDRRIGVAEDSPELELPQPNVSYLHSVPAAPGMDPNNAVSLEWCVAQFNRMRTDLLIIGETRGKEFFSFLTAANSGMEGCMTTLHATDPRMCLTKMSNYALSGASGQPQLAINRDIATAVNLIVQLIILPNGEHRVASITEVTNVVNESNGAITTGELYSYIATDGVFIKKGQMSDHLKTIMTERNVDIAPFLKTPIGQSMPLLPPSAATTEKQAFVESPSVRTSPIQSPSNGGLPLPGSRRI